MIKCRIWLFNVKFKEEDMFKVENIETYLNSLTALLNVNNLNYFEPEIERELKIPLDASKITKLSSGEGTANYLRVFVETTTRNQILYYYVRRLNWTSDNCVKLDLRLDTINSFVPNNLNNFLSPKTKIIRHHKDRFYNETIIGDSHTFRKIDLYSEGLVPVKYKTELGRFTQTKDISWGLLYRNVNAIDPSEVNQVNPVECFIIPEYSQVIKGYSQDVGIDYASTSSFPANSYIYFSVLLNIVNNNDSQEFTTTLPFTPEVKWKNQRTIVGSNYEESFTRIRMDNVNQRLYASIGYVKYHYNSSNQIVVDSLSFGVEYQLESANSFISFGNLNNRKLYYVVNQDGHDFPDDTPTFYLQNTSTILSYNSIGFDELDLTDSKIIKFIKLPYCPVEYSVDNSDNIIFNSDLKYDGTFKAFKTNNFNITFKSNATISSGIFNDLALGVLSLPLDRKVARHYKDSKLWHSDYLVNKFVYDSFGKEIAFERVNLSSLSYNSYNHKFSDVSLEFVPTRTINSRMMFRLLGFEYNYSLEDYDNIILVARNNEATLFSSQYLNYLRMGYNYDVKNKERQQINLIASTGASIVGATSGIALGYMYGNLGGAVLGGITGAVGVASTLINSANALAQTEDSMNAKLTQLQNQSASVYGADDIDLLENYSGNRAKLVKYYISERMEKALDDLFFYCGYSEDSTGVPNYNNRTFFNFIQCIPVIKPDYSVNIPEEFLEDIKAQLQNGITILHKYTYDDANTWDFEQQYENIETSLYN